MRINKDIANAYTYYEKYGKKYNVYCRRISCFSIIIQALF